jgi:hypothetical protein
VVLDGAGADVELLADLLVGVALSGEPGDLGFLGVRAIAVSTVRVRTFSPVAASSRRARSAKASMPMCVSHS